MDEIPVKARRGSRAGGHGRVCTYITVKALQDWARHLKEHGSAKDYLDHMLTFNEYFEFIGARAIREGEKQFL